MTKKIKKILIVDDCEDNRFVLNSLIKSVDDNIVILESWNGQEAVQIFELNPDIDCIIMDYQMPIMNGIDAICEIRGDLAEEDFDKIKISIFTASTLPEGELKCDDGYVIPILHKPITKEKLNKLLYGVDNL